MVLCISSLRVWHENLGWWLVTSFIMPFPRPSVAVERTLRATNNLALLEMAASSTPMVRVGEQGWCHVCAGPVNEIGVVWHLAVQRRTSEGSYLLWRGVLQSRIAAGILQRWNAAISSKDACDSLFPMPHSGRGKGFEAGFQRSVPNRLEKKHH